MIKVNVLKIGFDLDFISSKELIEWSDSKLADNLFKDLFLDLSSLPKNYSRSDVNDILNVLEQNFSSKEFEKFHSIVLSYLYKDLDDWKLVQYKLLHYFEFFDTSILKVDYHFKSRLRDDYYLRKDGFSGCMNMPDELEDYFEKFRIKVFDKSYLKTITNEFPNWLNQIC